MKSRLRPSDVLVPAAIAAVGILELFLVLPDGWVYGLALEAVTAVILIWRRFWPLLAPTSAAAVMLLLPWTGVQLDELATPILFLALIAYTLGRWIANLSGLIGIGLVLLMFLGDYLLVDVRTHDVTDVVFVMTLLLPPYIFGRITRKLAVQSELLARQQELIRDRAVRDERARIARDLHDVVAHSLSAMVVQTAAAQDLVRTHPDRAEEMLATVAQTGRNALAETGRLLHLIRDDADELGLAPAPGLHDVPALVDSFREAGLVVDAELAIEDEPMPGGVDVSAYRVVQEALTNALKYADGPVRLRVETAGPHVWISCSNQLGPDAVTGSGLGLRGMEERVRLLGGTLRHGPTTEHRFEVDAVIPLASQVPA